MNRHNPMRHQIGLTAFFNSVNAKILSKHAPESVLRDPLIVGQYIHEVLDDSCAVYLVICTETDPDVSYVKIGLARSVRKRVATIQTTCPLEIRKAIYFVTAGYKEAYAMERAMHTAFGRYRVNGEWFKLKGKGLREKVVTEMLEWAEEYMADDFNSWLYDPAKGGKVCSEDVETFLRMLWALNNDKFDYAEMEEIIKLTVTSEDHFERVQNCIQQGKY